jgi:hypothetical protein
MIVGFENLSPQPCLWCLAFFPLLFPSPIFPFLGLTDRGDLSPYARANVQYGLLSWPLGTLSSWSLMLSVGWLVRRPLLLLV